jgi:endo-1,4-beta-xylanase
MGEKEEYQMKQKIMLLFLAILLYFTFTNSAINVQAATTITSNQTGVIDGYNYELWKDSGTTSMTLNGGGKFSCSWSNINNALFRIGKKFDSTQTHQQLGNISVNYACNYQPNGNSYLCVYGWTRSPLVEYYIVDSWGSWRPPGSTSKGTISADGGTYDVYETTRTNQPSIDGTATFQQYWSVRTAKRASGTISVTQHFNQWANKGMTLGKMYECALTVEGYQSSGTADVTSNTITIGGSATPTVTATPIPTQSVTPTESPSPSKSPSPSPSATSGGYSVSYTQNDWGSGATVSVTITNNGATAINGWTLGWTFSGNQKITNMWNGRYTQNGTAVSVTNQSYNATIPARGTVSFGFNLSYSGTNAKPTNFTLNGSSNGATASPSSIYTPVSTPTPTATLTTTDKFHCFLLLGQSNMAGYPKAQDSDKVQNQRILVLDYDTNQWRVAVPPLHETWQGAIGPGDWFSKTIINELPAGDTIGLIPCAISGEKIETFMKSGGSKYNWIIQRSQLAQQKGGVIEGILFHQGCSNNGDSTWPGKVKTLVTDLRNDLNLGNVPFIAGELLYSGSCAGHNTLVNQLPSVITNCYVVSASGLVVDPADTQWGLHFGHDSQVTLGKRYAEKMIKALNW